VGGGGVVAGSTDVVGARTQWAAELRATDGSILGSKWGGQGAITIVHGSEPYRVAGPDSGTGRADFNAFSYSRLGARVGAIYALTPLSRLTLGGRAERVVAELPGAPVRLLGDGTAVPVRLDLEPGH